MRRPEAPLQLTIAHTDHWLVSVSGEVDASANTELCSLAELLRTGGDSVDFDLSLVSFVDGGGWRAVCASADLVRSAGLAARVINPSPSVRRIIELLRKGDPVNLHEATAHLAPVA